MSQRHLLGELWVTWDVPSMAGGLLAGELCPGSTQIQQRMGQTQTKSNGLATLTIWTNNKHAPMPLMCLIFDIWATRCHTRIPFYVLKAKKTSKLPFEQRIGLWLWLLKNKKNALVFLWLGLFPCCFFCEETWHLRPAQRGFSFYAWGREKPERPQSKTCSE